MNKNVERGRTTRAQLIDVATRLFAARGYDATSIEAVLAESGASRGSLYHHFKSKEALFLAVMEDAGARATQPTVEAMGAAPDSLAALRIACLAWVRLACDPVVRQIMLIDAPAVLGWERWRELDEHGALGIVRDLLADVAQDGRIEMGDVDRSEALARGERAVEEFLNRLLGSGVSNRS
jgi:AcrR family transcriptional regulator